MPSKETLDRIKRATVALAMAPKSPPIDPRQTPYTIVGSGFCIDPSGVVVTCAHVIEAFVHQDVRAALKYAPEDDQEGVLREIGNFQMSRPHVLFFQPVAQGRFLVVVSPSIRAILGSKMVDLGLIHLNDQKEFRTEFPFLELEHYATLYEGLDVATCGFPLGNAMQDMAGTKTSSFTRGILSSIAPMQGVPENKVTKFQLNITATHGNSGGPVFSWETGRVFGALSSGPASQAGIAFAEPVYPLLRDGLVDRIKVFTPPDSPSGAAI